MITLYSKDGITEKAQINKFSYQGTFLSECFLNTTISSPTPINFEIGDYCVFRDEHFELNYIPAKEKQASSGSHGEAFIYDNIKFNSLADELTRVEFLDVVLHDNEVHGSSLPSFSFSAFGVKDLAERIQANLNREFTGDKKWTITVLPELTTPDKFITVSKITVWDAVQLANTEFKANFTIRNRTITIGTSGYAVGSVFGYGKGNGLYDIQQNTNQDSKIITRLRAYGSTRNIPLRYYNKLVDGSGNPYIEAGVYIPNLMLPEFPYTENNPSKVFIDSDTKSEYGIREGSVYFDGSGEEDNEIYPSLEGMTRDELESAGIIVSLPSGDNGHIDEVLGADNPTDDGLIPEEGEGEIDGQFTFYLKDLGFDLSEKDSDGQYKYSSADTMQINMKSGMCSSRTFDVIENGITKDTSLGYTRFKVECNRFTDDSINGGTAFPNSQYRIESGDKFVILGIDMPDVYIKAAAQRLKVAAEEYLSQNDSTKYTYTPKIDELFMARHPEIGEGIKEGDLFNFADTDLDIDASVIIQNLKINYDLDSKLIPTYEVTLSNDKIATKIDKMQNAINTLQSNVTGLSIDSIKTLINSIGSSLFLSKNFNDTAKGLIKFIKGLDIGDFSSGAFGGGGTFRMNDQNQSYLEVDKLYVRMQAVFRELVIERLSHIGGAMVLSPARLKCTKVEEHSNYYRCYFDTGDNNEVVNEFALNDQARCQVFNGSLLKYYWRLVVGVGTDYIELSKTDFDGSGIPEVGDEIIQLGNRFNLNRQNAQILSSFGEDAPSFKQYDGIDSYSLEGKEKTVIAPNGNNKFDGAVTIGAGSSGWENIDGLSDKFDGLLTGAVNLLRNTGFTGDYASKILNPDTQLTPDTNLFSESLGFWNGSGTVNADSNSTSGHSVTLLDQTLSQPVSTIFTESYVLSFKAKGVFVDFNVSGTIITETLESEYKQYVIKLQAGDTALFSMTGRCTICEIQLERGTIGSSWSSSPLDNDKTLAQFEAIRFITDSVKNGKTTILGGLILSSLINVGNYVNGEMTKVTAGMSGIYNDPRDIAFWAGGDLMKALANSMNPFTTDPSKMINFAVTHGGRLIANEAIIRGHITATSGTIGGFNIAENELTSTKKSLNGNPFIKLNGMDGSGYLAGGNISWDELGDLLMLGKFESNKDGNRIVIDPDTRSIKMLSGEGVNAKEVMVMEFEEKTEGGVVFLSPKITLNHWMGNTINAWVEIKGYEAKFFDIGGYQAYIQPKSMGLFNPNETSAPSFGASIGSDTDNQTALMVSMDGLPTSKDKAIFGLYTTVINGNTVICRK